MTRMGGLALMQRSFRFELTRSSAEATGLEHGGNHMNLASIPRLLVVGLAFISAGCGRKGDSSATSGTGGGGAAIDASAGSGGASGGGGGGVPGSGGGTGTGGATGAGGGGVMTLSEPAPGMYTVGMPSDPGSWAGMPATGGNAPVIIYPSDQTRFPRNIYRTLFQWKSQGYGQFRLTFTGPRTTVQAFTDGKHQQCTAAGAACWEADEQSWFLIASGNAGSTVTLTVDGLDPSTTPATVRRSSVITIGFSKQNVEGAIFYWSTTVAGIRRASVSAAVPENYLAGKPPTTYATPADSVKCAACHVVSRDGKYMVAPVEAMSGGSLWITEVTKMAPPTPLVKNIPNTKGHGFATISPDDSRVVAAWGGKMWLLDRATGNKLSDIALGGLQATHPDWSPDNSQLVFATGNGDAPGGAGLATVSWNGSTWGQPAVIVEGSGKKMMMPPGGMQVGGSNLFPMHSPDGKWIAFSRGKGGHGDLSAALWVVGAKGGAPVELTNANRVVSNQTTDGLSENNQPTWAPPGDYHWIAFNSQREYGLVSPKGTQQIWVAAVDPAKLGGGADPSYPAFRLQFQGLTEDNHRAYWTLDVRDTPVTPPPPTPDAGMCVATGAKCDPVADTCCERGVRCDSQDDGMTYTCMAPLIP